MQEKERIKYAEVVSEIKRRTQVIDAFLFGTNNALYKVTTLELICLQIRKILELIALGSLVANQKIFKQEAQKLQTMWNAKHILNDIERINPHFYPKPIIEKKSSQPNTINKIENMISGYLTKDDFIHVYEKCGKILHSENPLGKNIDYSYYEKNLPVWREKIIHLLNAHIITLLNDENLYVVHMQEEGKDFPSVYVLGKIN